MKTEKKASQLCIQNRTTPYHPNKKLNTIKASILSKITPLITPYVFLAIGILFTSTTFSAQLNVSNPVISVGTDNTKGGAITSFKVLGTEVVNNFDLGRQFQPDLRDAYTGWTNYNPTQAGDACGTPSGVLEFYKVNNRTLHSKSQAREWHSCTISDAQVIVEPTIGDGSPGAPYEIMEIWIAWYSGNNHTFYYDSAMPALAMRKDILTRLFTYNGNSPWANGALTEIHPNPAQMDWIEGNKENFMAWMKSDLSWGVALYFRGTERFSIAFSDHSFLQATLPNKQNYYIPAEQKFQIFPPPVVIVGNLQTIRSIVYGLHSTGR